MRLSCLIGSSLILKIYETIMFNWLIFNTEDLWDYHVFKIGWSLIQKIYETIMFNWLIFNTEDLWDYHVSIQKGSDSPCKPCIKVRVYSLFNIVIIINYEFLIIYQSGVISHISHTGKWVYINVVNNKLKSINRSKILMVNGAEIYPRFPALIAWDLFSRAACILML